MLQCRSAETELIGTAGHVFALGMGVEQGYMDSFQDLKSTSTLIKYFSFKKFLSLKE